MGKVKKVDYGAMFSYDEKRGLYYCSRVINGVTRKFRAKDAEALYHKVEAAINEKDAVPTFGAIAEDWERWKYETIEDNTIACYKPNVKRAVEALGACTPVDRITPADVTRLIMQMKAEGYSAQSVKTQKAVLKMIFDYAIIQDHAAILYNPAASVTVPRGLPRKKRECPNDSVMQTIIDSVDTVPFGLFPFLLLYTGCRRGEALALTWGDIDTANDLIHVTKEYAYPYGKPILKTTKTEAGIRSVTLLADLKRHLTRPRDAKDDDLIFHGDKPNVPLGDSKFKSQWLDFCRATGYVEARIETRKNKDGSIRTFKRTVPTLTPHQLRHGYATLLFESGVDTKTSQNQLGHADIHTTMQTYTAIREAHKITEIKKLGDYIEQKYHTANASPA